ncbi:MAG: 50S ribosomal protein L32 [bacterium]
MGALPKRKLSKQRKGKRRSHLALKPPTMSKCPECGKNKLPHTVCPNCGTYKNVQVINVD